MKANDQLTINIVAMHVNYILILNNTTQITRCYMVVMMLVVWQLAIATCNLVYLLKSSCNLATSSQLIFTQLASYVLNYNPYTEPANIINESRVIGKITLRNLNNTTKHLPLAVMECNKHYSAITNIYIYIYMYVYIGVGYHTQNYKDV